MSNTHNKHPLILFSGGMDSSYLLDVVLTKSPVYTLYVDGGQGELKVKQELAARHAVITAIYKEHSANRTTIHTILGDFYEKSFSNFGGDLFQRFTGFKQVQSWLLAALLHANPEIVSEVQMAYCADDQMVLRINELKMAWEGLWKLSYSEPLVPITFPLIDAFVSKLSVVRNIPSYIRDKTWVCELPVIQGKKVLPCGRCPACAKLIGTLKQNEVLNHSL